MLNAGDSEAHVAVHHFHHFFADRDPMRPYRIMVPARAPLPVPRDRAFSSVFESGVPIVVQHTHTARFEPPRRDLIVNNRLQRILKLASDRRGSKPFCFIPHKRKFSLLSTRFPNTRCGMEISSQCRMNETKEWNLSAVTPLLQHGIGGETRDCDRRIQPRCAGKIR